MVELNDGYSSLVLVPDKGAAIARYDALVIGSPPVPLLKPGDGTGTSGCQLLVPWSNRISGGGFDLPELSAAFASYVGESQLTGRLRFQPGNFFQDNLPGADVLVFGRVLHTLLGYADQPSRLQVVAYAVVLFGGFALSKLFASTHPTPRRVAAAE